MSVVVRVNMISVELQLVLHRDAANSQTTFCRKCQSIADINIALARVYPIFALENGKL